MKTVVKQKWEESERGWGTRPDGYSLHLNDTDRKEYIKEYWKKQTPGQAPDEYSRPYGNGVLFDVTDELYREVSESKNGIRIF